MAPSNSERIGKGGTKRGDVGAETTYRWKSMSARRGEIGDVAQFIQDTLQAAGDIVVPSPLVLFPIRDLPCVYAA
jgi:hypothetical protein